MFVKGVAVTGFPFSLLSSTTGAATAGLTVTGRILKDGGTQGTLTNAAVDEGNGQYSVDLTSGEMTATTIGLLFTATGAVSVAFTIKTVVANVDDSVRLGLTALPNAAAAATGGLPTVDGSNAVKVQSGTGANQISLSSGLVTLAGVTHTGAVIPTVTTVGTLTTYTGNTPQTGDAYAIVNDSAFGNSKLVRSTTPANTLDVASTGEAGLDFNNIKDATGAHTLTNITVPTVTTTTTATNVTTVNGLAAGVITAASIAADAITDAKVASDVTIASVTGAVGSVTGAVGSVTGNVGGNVVGTSGLNAAATAAIWDQLRVGHIGGGSFGEALGVFMSMVEFSTDHYRYLTNALEQAPTAAAIADAVWDEAQSGHTTAGTFGKFLDAAVSGVSTGGVSASDIATAVWHDLLASSDFSTSASIGKLIKDNLDAAISSRSTFAGGAVASVTGNVGGNVNGNVAGSVGSVTGAVGSVTGAVGSVTGNVGGNVVGSTASVAGAVGSVTGAVGSVTGDVGGRVLGGGSGTITGDGVRASSVTGAVGSVTAAVSLSAAAVDLIWDEAQSGHTTTGTFGKYLDAQVSAAGGGGLTEAGIADAVWDELLSGHVGVGSASAILVAASGGGGGGTVNANIISINGEDVDPLAVVPASVVQWAGVDVGTPHTPGYPVVTIKDGSGVGELETTGGVLDAVGSVSQPVEVGGEVSADLVKINGDAFETAALFPDLGVTGTVTDPDGTATAAGFKGDSGLSAANDWYVNGPVLAFTSGDLKGQARPVTGYSGSTRAFTFDVPFPAAPGAGDTFVILGYSRGVT